VALTVLARFSGGLNSSRVAHRHSGHVHIEIESDRADIDQFAGPHYGIRAGDRFARSANREDLNG